jgi:hypothetical protein
MTIVPTAHLVVLRPDQKDPCAGVLARQSEESRILENGNKWTLIIYQKEHGILWQIGMVVGMALATLATIFIGLAFEGFKNLWREAFTGKEIYKVEKEESQENKVPVTIEVKPIIEAAAPEQAETQPTQNQQILENQERPNSFPMILQEESPVQEQQPSVPTKKTYHAAKKLFGCPQENPSTNEISSKVEIPMPPPSPRIVYPSPSGTPQKQGQSLSGGIPVLPSRESVNQTQRQLPPTPQKDVDVKALAPLIAKKKKEIDEAIKNNGFKGYAQFVPAMVSYLKGYLGTGSPQSEIQLNNSHYQDLADKEISELAKDKEDSNDNSKSDNENKPDNKKAKEKLYIYEQLETYIKVIRKGQETKKEEEIYLKELDSKIVKEVRSNPDMANKIIAERVQGKATGIKNLEIFFEKIASRDGKESELINEIIDKITDWYTIGKVKHELLKSLTLLDVEQEAKNDPEKTNQIIVNQTKEIKTDIKDLKTLIDKTTVLKLEINKMKEKEFGIFNEKLKDLELVMNIVHSINEQYIKELDKNNTSSKKSFLKALSFTNVETEITTNSHHAMTVIRPLIAQTNLVKIGDINSFKDQLNKLRYSIEKDQQVNPKVLEIFQAIVEALNLGRYQPQRTISSNSLKKF